MKQGFKQGYTLQAAATDLMAWAANAGATPLRTVFHSQSSGSLSAVTKSGIPAGPINYSQ